MDQRTTIVVAVAVAVAAVAVIMGWLYSRKHRTRILRERFGPEYDRVVHQEGNQRRAEGLLEFRQERRERFVIRPLERAQRAEFANRWMAVQGRFVDDPRAAVTDADLLITEVMTARGYPMSDFEQRAADISVDHPVVVENYRAAHTIASRKEVQSTTEELRKAMVHYRSLFEELLEESSTSPKEKLA